MSLETVESTNEVRFRREKRPVVASPTALRTNRSMSKYDTDADNSDVECPTCGRDDFASLRGVSIHHTTTHGESLPKPKKSCEWCGDDYETRWDRQDESRFCSPECLNSWKSEAYSDPEPDYCDAQCPTCGREDFLTYRGMRKHHNMVHGESIAFVTNVCEQCGEEYRVRHDHSERSRFCSYDCHDGWRSENKSGENSPTWEGGPVAVNCAMCGESKEVQRSVSESQDRFFCDKQCLAEWQSENWTGENGPRWKEGRTRHNTAAWRQSRQKALERDDYRCQSCGLSRDEHHKKYGRDLEVHHIIPYRKFDIDEKANALPNLITLCQSCHTRWEGIPLAPDRRD